MMVLNYLRFLVGFLKQRQKSAKIRVNTGSMLRRRDPTSSMLANVMPL